MSKLQINQSDLKDYYHNNKTMIWNYKTLYQIFYSVNAGYYIQPIFKKISNGVGVTLRGRYIAMSIEDANRYTVKR